MKHPLEEKAQFVTAALHVVSKLILLFAVLTVLCFLGRSIFNMFYYSMFSLEQCWWIVKTSFFILFTAFTSFAVLYAFAVIVEAVTMSAMAAHKKQIKEDCK